MSLARKAIRRAIGQALFRRTAAQERVYTNRPEANWDITAPTIFIRSTREQVDPKSFSPRVYDRTLTIEIGCIVADALAVKGKVDDQADDLAQQVEDILLHDPALDQLPALAKIVRSPKDSGLRSAELDMEVGDRVLAGWTITLEVRYVTTHLPPSQRTLSPLEAFDIDWDLAPPDELVEAKDEVKVPVS